MSNNQSTTTKKLLKADTPKTGITIDNTASIDNSYKISFTGGDSAQYDSYFDQTWVAARNMGAEWSDNNHPTTGYGGYSDNIDNPKYPQNHVYCAEDGQTYNYDRNVAGTDPYGQNYHHYFPRCHYNNNYYDGTFDNTFKDDKDANKNETNIKENKVACCKGEVEATFDNDTGNDTGTTTRTIKDTDGKFLIKQCAYITDDIASNEASIGGRTCCQNTNDNWCGADNNPGCANYVKDNGSGWGTIPPCRPISKAQTWAPWSKTCAIETDVIKDKCSEMTVITGDTKNNKYNTIYMWVPLTEDTNSNCNKWKGFKNVTPEKYKDIEGCDPSTTKSDPLYGSCNVPCVDNNDAYNLYTKINKDYDAIVTDFCKLQTEEDIYSTNNNNLRGFSFPCSCVNYYETPLYQGLLKTVQDYCDANPLNADCDSALNNPQCWLPNCRDANADILKRTSADFQSNCPQINCDVFVAIADNTIGGDLTVGSVTVDACSEVTEAYTPTYPKLRYLIFFIVTGLVILTAILFIFKFSKKK